MKKKRAPFFGIQFSITLLKIFVNVVSVSKAFGTPDIVRNPMLKWYSSVTQWYTENTEYTD